LNVKNPFDRLFLHALNAIYVSRISGKLSFCNFGTEFFKKLMDFRQKLSDFVLFPAFYGQIFENYTFLGGLELSFWAKTEFFKILGT